MRRKTFWVLIAVVCGKERYAGETGWVLEVEQAKRFRSRYDVHVRLDRLHKIAKTPFLNPYAAKMFEVDAAELPRPKHGQGQPSDSGAVPAGSAGSS